MYVLHLLALIFLASQCQTDDKYVFISAMRKRNGGSSSFISISSVNSVVGCGRHCKERADCLAASLCGNDCHLSNETTNNSFDKLEDDNNCTYMELLKKCHHGGTWKANMSQCVDCDYGFTGTRCERPIIDCAEGRDLGYTGSGLITIQPIDAKEAFTVVCTFSDGGTQIERRGTQFKCGSFENFNRTWDDYKNGFGDLNCEFFIGLQNMHLLAAQRRSRLRVMLYGPNSDHANYWDFVIDNEANSYSLHYNSCTIESAYPGGDGFGLGAPTASVNHSPFCTPDRDCGSCARDSSSGWWFNTACSDINLHVPLFLNGGMQWPKSLTDPTKGGKANLMLYLYRM